ncbi:aminotransferase DegT [Candidatus Beckwithbacteria bacterium CG23_combo_of_CG06-09_8_20_14_all_34_8]|uniref:Aminotransferase DegT n=1 Tax=Candidatus Beckwithbacteria bacterium CG23_combo_of_CG06-09_8_20_14_all_34_8 TaxID=1974497 RepID=A0A2H0B752_9BACT|nr:MAG: aminotransferase DegT [Candidatus Beckwithbacteria bacterium CG23_combo_of_CG06-09_8_20_14_all_34_8]
MLKNIEQTQMIPVNEPVVSKEAKQNVNLALDTGWLSSAGSYVKEFEDQFAKYLGVKHAITVNTGTAALHVALLSAGIGPGDEVIVPAFTMAATWLAVIYTGAKPVFVDVEKDTYNINPKLIEQKITNHTKAIMPVHIYGHPADMDAIMIIAKDHHLLVIEDAAEAHGATYKSQLVGSLGTLGCFSFYANKLIATGEGGMIVTNNDEYAEEARKYKDLYHSSAKRFIHEKIGYNYRMTNLQAGIGLGELIHINEYIAKKQHMAQLYANHLSDLQGIILPVTRPNVTNVFWMYALRIDENKFGLNKNIVRDKLYTRGIDTRDFFYPPENQPILSDYLESDEQYPITSRIASEGFYLPSGLAITDEQINTITDTLHQIAKQLH